MDPIQQKSLNALEPFILLSKSANSPRAAADLVTQATSAPNAYTFAELLELPNIQNLKTVSSEYASYYTLLEIFAWGTWEDYNSQKSTLPSLTPLQSTKLRQLSLLSLASKPHQLTYAHLLSALSIPDVRALEDLIISAIYAGLSTAQLNPLAQRIDVSSVASVRDLPPGAVSKMIGVMEEWEQRCLGVLEELEGQVREVKIKAAEKKKRDEILDRHFKRLVSGVPANAAGAGTAAEDGKTKGSVGKRAVGDEDEMDVDDGTGAAGGRGKNAKRGGKMGVGFGRKGPE